MGPIGFYFCIFCPVFQISKKFFVFLNGVNAQWEEVTPEWHSVKVTVTLLKWFRAVVQTGSCDKLPHADQAQVFWIKHAMKCIFYKPDTRKPFEVLVILILLIDLTSSYKIGRAVCVASGFIWWNNILTYIWLRNYISGQISVSSNNRLPYISTLTAFTLRCFPLLLYLATQPIVAIS